MTIVFKRLAAKACFHDNSTVVMTTGITKRFPMMYIICLLKHRPIEYVALVINLLNKLLCKGINYLLLVCSFLTNKDKRGLVFFSFFTKKKLNSMSESLDRPTRL